MSKPIVRDYKRNRRQGLDLSRWREFSVGLGIGLAVAALVFVYQRNTLRAVAAEAAQPKPQRSAAVQSAADAAAVEAPAAKYDFYDMLPKFEVVVPERDREVKRDVPATAVERAGVYVLQAGSFRELADAERVSAQLQLLGIDAKVQRVAVDADVWHRVRIGPLNDLGEINRIRDKLRAAELSALVIRVGD